MKYAYVNLLYGDNIYFITTLVFILSLIQSNPKKNIDRVLCYTYDVPEYKLDILKQYYTKLVKIEYIRTKTLEKKRFQDIFTKLQIMKLYEYDKILFLDNDMIINKNIDHLFELKTPAGVATGGHQLKYKHNELIKDKNVIINAGLLLLNPNKKDYYNLLKKIKYLDNNILEQEFLSNYYEKKWTYISNLYNYQVGFRYINNETPFIKMYKNIKLKDIYVFHYSSEKKPWNFNSKRQLDIFWMKYFNIINEKYKEHYKIDLLKIRESKLNNLENYIKEKFPKCIINTLNQTQKEKLNKKLNETIINSTKNNNKNYSYKEIINILMKNNIKVYLFGGCIRDLYNDDIINDIDIVYNNNYEEIQLILENIDNLNYKQGIYSKKYFIIGDSDNSLDINNIDKALTNNLNAPINMLLYDIKNNKVYDITGEGINDIKNNIFKKPKNAVKDIWLKNNLIIRLYKFIKKNYNINNKDKKLIYDYYYYNNHDFIIYNSINQFIKKNNDFFDIIKNDIDTLNLKYNGTQFIKSLKNDIKKSFIYKTF